MIDKVIWNAQTFSNMIKTCELEVLVNLFTGCLLDDLIKPIFLKKLINYTQRIFSEFRMFDFDRYFYDLNRYGPSKRS